MDACETTVWPGTEAQAPEEVGQQEEQRREELLMQPHPMSRALLSPSEAHDSDDAILAARTH